jgi:hypothetical protein
MITERMKVSTRIGIITDIFSESNSISYHDSKVRVVNTPNRISEAMFPISVVPINQVGFWMKKDMIFAPIFPLFPCNSICILFADKNATSIPDKNIEKISEPVIAAR